MFARFSLQGHCKVGGLLKVGERIGDLDKTLLHERNVCPKKMETLFGWMKLGIVGGRERWIGGK